MKLEHYRKRAIKKGLEFNLTTTWLIEKLKGGKCEATGMPFKIRPSNTTINPYYPSIDRIDSSKGYTQDNCQIVIHGYNILKSSNNIEIVKLFCNNFVEQYEKEHYIK